MIRHACPNCEREFHTSDELAGLTIKCWNCLTVVEVPRPVAQTAVAAGAPPLTEEEEAAGDDVGLLQTLKESGERLLHAVPLHKAEAEPAHRGHCMICGETGLEVRRCTLRIVRGAPWILSAVARRMNVQGWACDACYGKGSGLTWIRWGGLAVALLVLVLGYWGVGNLGGVIEQGGFSEGAAKAIGLALLAAPAVICFLVLLVSRLLLRRRMKAAVGKEFDRRLKELAGVERWGYFTTFCYSHHRHEGEPSVHL